MLLVSRSADGSDIDITKDRLRSANGPEWITKTVFLMETDEEFEATRRTIASLGYSVVTGANCDDPSKCLAAVINHDADPDLEACKRFSEHCKVFLRSSRTGFEFKLHAVRSGVTGMVQSPFDVIEIGDVLSAARSGEFPNAKVLIIDDDDLTSEYYGMALEASGLRVKVLNDPMRSEEVVRDFCPDLVIMDVDMPGANGLEVAQALRMDPVNVSLPILFLSAETRGDIKDRAREIGGDVFISKPVDLTTLIRMITMRVSRAVELRQVMERDSLTGLLNHGNFKERLAAELKRTQRTGSPIAVTLMDLDRFKSINDTFGHQFGDKVIQGFAKCLQTSLRSVDVIGRYGGEEFAIILLDTTPEKAATAIDQIRLKFQSIQFEHPDGCISVTFSSGLAGSDSASTAEDILLLADKALYEAKRRGRNRICVHSEDIQ